MSVEPLTEKRNASLDGFRGFPVILVFLSHSRPSLLWSANSGLLLKSVNKVVAFSNFSVDIFFVLSGFLITGILLKLKEKAATQSGDEPLNKRLLLTRNFYARRALRIFPAYYLMLSFCLCLLPMIIGASASGWVGSPNYRYWLWFYGTNIVESLHNDWLFADLNQLWSLAIEEQFYLIWPLVILILNKRLLKRLCLFIIFCSPVVRFVFAGTLHMKVTAYLCTVCRLDTLALGALIAVLVSEGKLATLMRPAKIVATASIALVPTYMFFLVERSVADLVFDPTMFGTIFASYLVLVLGETFLAKVFQNPILRFLGKYSYSFYLYHLLVIGFFGRIIWRPIEKPELLNFVLIVPLTFAASLGIALLSYHLVEKHFLRLKDNFPVD